MKHRDASEATALEAAERDRDSRRESDPVHEAMVEEARLAMHPRGEARHDLIEATMTRLEPRKRKLERPPARWESAVAGLLVGLAMFAFLVGRMTEAEAAPLLVRAVASVVVGGVVAVYLWRRDRRE
ncbi:MAG: hypothetical protein F4187_10535 [Gemmatimonadetes bacterium]|nr:hypothetical protein [Gemmatimonadota bacterium]